MTAMHLGTHRWPTVRDLQANGRTVLSRLGFDDASQRFGFHIPRPSCSPASQRPTDSLDFAAFSSVPHLHLHCFGLPFRSLFRQSLKYRPSGITSLDSTGKQANGRLDKGWGWFVTVDQAVAILGRGEKVRVRGSG